jgi:predicted ATPase/transcriptional regulator with XRE-family HTH domain
MRDAESATEQPAPSFAGLLRKLRVEAKLTQEELARVASVSPRSVSDLERGVTRTAHKDTALLLADALGLPGPVREVFVAAARGQVPAADVLAAMSASRNNLPTPVDSFVGRQMEMAEITRAVRTGRLVTLTGPGGSGKTRLALEAAAALVPEFADGVWLVELATISDSGRLPGTVAQVLGVSDRSGEALGDTLAGWLRDRHLLLILDNCEHVVDAVGGFCERLLPACGRLRILATSREFLDVHGEHAIQTPPLAVPDDPALAPLSDAVRLFLARAAARAPGFRPDEADLGMVMQVCRRLDGLPLAIELAAARLRALSLSQLATRLDDQFWLLTGASRTKVSRQRTLEAVVAWSYDLLREVEQRTFARLAVFPDHFTLEMAEAVAFQPGDGEFDVVDTVARLVDKSLVTAVNTPDGLRYRMLEMLRQYGHDRLAEHGDLDRFQERLFAWAMSGVEHLELVMRTPAMDEALHTAAINAVTYRAAMQWADSHGQQGAALRIAAMVPLSHHGWERRTEILERLNRADKAAQLDDMVAGHSWTAIANLCFEQNDWQASLQAGTRAVEHFKAARLPRLTSWAQFFCLIAAWGDGRPAEVDRLVSEAIASFRRERDDVGLGWSLLVASLRSVDLEAAEQMAAEADELLRRAGVPMGVAHNLEGRGIIAFERGELSEAARLLTEAIQAFASYGNIGCTAHALEAAAVVIATAAQEGDSSAVELLAAAEQFRQQSGQAHRPWEMQARLEPLKKRISTRSATAGIAAHPLGRRYTLSVASMLAAQALQSVEAPTPADP